ncbi:uncharacterized protein BX663DRAFT_502267 [Cokeromyces recurvatus]|uniref:uncharacterized protein n=1 Tax=Cokeromyces recurvatus TaxID=90255 RepID=UPI0022200402|nr:uncharacterized protein BX663DRAFT_502267 [Cokeromyces recurvatus]KAI7905254.1 hypothetical protein BX663DRAFT_502267 [Cokeromyces recurvatus]
MITNKVLILYCPFKPDQPIPNVDQVTLKGSSGQIALEETANSSKLDILQLLGLYDIKSNNSLQARFKERFNDMSLAIISNSTLAINIAIELNCIQHSIIESTSAFVAYINDLKVDVIFIDFTDYCDNKAWKMIDELVFYYQDVFIQYIISPPSPVIGKEEEEEEIMDIKPIQSYLIKDGTLIKSISSFLFYSSIGFNRKDTTTKYSFINNKNVILAWHLMAEIGYKLGFIQKYGT